MKRSIALLLLAAGSHAAVIQIPADYSSIQAGIEVAAPGDTVLVQPGTYFESLDLLGKEITVTGTAPDDWRTVHRTVIDASSDEESRSVVVFLCGEGRGTTLAGLLLTGGSGTPLFPHLSQSTVGGGIFISSAAGGVAISPTIYGCIISGNQALGSHGAGKGGGVHVFGGEPLLQRCIIENNSGRWGGGIYCGPSTDVTLQECVVSANESSWNGGGVVSRGSYPAGACPTSEDSIIQNNEAEAGGGGIDLWRGHGSFFNTVIRNNICTWAGHGGGINCTLGGTVLADRCVIKDNAATYSGGGLHSTGDSVVLTQCSIGGNRTIGSGGGIYVWDVELRIEHCTFTDNQAEVEGGAICAEDAPASVRAIISGSVLAGNSATIGGALYSSNRYYYRFDISNCTIVGNRASDHGDGIVYENPDHASVLKNCILWDHAGDPLAGGGLFEVSYCDIQGGHSGWGNIDQDPLLLSWQGYDYLLAPGSPCIDAGDPALSDAIYDSHPRWPAFHHDGVRCDMGAYGGPENDAWLP
jgi:predicted outer membrane repeat protein